MLRRVKSDVENELAPKTEIELRCELSSRQKRLYQVSFGSSLSSLSFFSSFISAQHVRRNVSLAEIGMLQKSIEKGKGKPSDLQMGRLMNIVMQFRKVYHLSFSLDEEIIFLDLILKRIHRCVIIPTFLKRMMFVLLLHLLPFILMQVPFGKIQSPFSFPPFFIEKEGFLVLIFCDFFFFFLSDKKNRRKEL